MGRPKGSKNQDKNLPESKNSTAEALARGQWSEHLDQYRERLEMILAALISPAIVQDVGAREMASRFSTCLHPREGIIDEALPYASRTERGETRRVSACILALISAAFKGWVHIPRLETEAEKQKVLDQIEPHIIKLEEIISKGIQSYNIVGEPGVGYQMELK